MNGSRPSRAATMPAAAMPTPSMERRIRADAMERRAHRALKAFSRRPPGDNGSQMYLSRPPAFKDVAEREEISEIQILASLLGVAEMVGGLTDIEELTALIARVTPGLVRVDRCAIMAYDESAREFRTLSSFAPGMKRTPFDGLTVQEAEIPWLAQRLIALRLPALIKATSGESGLSPALQQRFSLRSALVVPLAARGRFLGLLWLDDTRSPHYFTSEEINIVQGIAAEVAQILYALRRKAGTRGYVDRLMDSIDGLVSIHPAEPPE